MTGPLVGIRILDLSRVLAGPFCTQLLGDLGAEVIKVESPFGGDDTRQWGPTWNEISCYFLAINRNKKSLAVNLKSEQGRDIIKKLINQSDVVIENFRPGVTKRLQLDYENLSRLNPQLVYCSLSGFGQEGPRNHDPAYDLLMQAFSGLMSMTGYPNSPPVRAGLPVTDLTLALYAAIGILAALQYRNQHGKGQKVETSLLQGQISWLSYYVVGYFANHVLPRGMGSSHHSLLPYRAYRAKDEYFVLAVGNRAQWERLCEAIDRPDLKDDPRFDTNLNRLNHRQELDEILEKIFNQKTVGDLLSLLKLHDVPCSPINTIDRVVGDPQVKHLGMIQECPHPQIPDLKMPGIPFHFSETPGKIRLPPPILGEHSDEILHKLGYRERCINELRSEGIIA